MATNTGTPLDRRVFLAAGAAGLAAAAACNAQPESIRLLDPSKPLRVGMIGSDGHAGYVTSGLKGIPGAKLIAWAKGGPLGASTTTRAIETSGATVYDDYRQMFDKEQLDVVGICLPFAWNAQAGIDAAERSVHVMIEKPSAVTLEDLNALEKAVRSNRVRSTLMLEMRLSSPVQAMKRAIVDGRIGTPILATSQKTYKFGPSRPDFYKDRGIYGGTIPWVAIHGVDMMQYATGLQFTHVAAFHTNFAHTDYGQGMEDAGGILLRLSNGGSAICNFDFLRPDGAPTHGDNRLRVAGSTGVIEMLDYDIPEKRRVVLMAGSEPPTELPLQKEKSLFVDFMDELYGRGVHVLTQDECFRITRVMLLARQAADTGTLISLDA